MRQAFSMARYGLLASHAGGRVGGGAIAICDKILAGIRFDRGADPVDNSVMFSQLISA